MAETIHELVTKIRPEGVSETQNALDDTTEKFSETTDEVKDQTSLLSDFSSRWQGAAQVLVAGVGVLAAGLLSKLPILQSVASGLNAILTSVALKMDETLRPALQPISDLLFKIANSITEINGPMGKLIGIAATVGTVLAVVAGVIAAIGVSIGPIMAGLGALSTVFTVLAGVVTTVISVIVGVLSLPIIIIGLLVAAIVGAYLAWKNNLFGIRDKTKAAVDKIVKFFTDLKSKTLEELTVLWIKGKALFEKLTTSVKSILSTGFQKAKNAVFGILNDLAAGVEEKVNQAISALNKFTGKNFSNVSLGRLETETVTSPNLSQQMAAIDQNAQQQISETRNRFARQRQEVELTLGPEADKLLSEKMGAGPSNRGR